MTTCLLIRHGQSQANTEGVLAGHLDSPLTQVGGEQARTVAESLRGVPIRSVVTSPLGRCRDTAAEICAVHPGLSPPHIDERIAEVRYGAWTGRKLSELANEDLWRTIQARPSEVSFPPDAHHAHESMTDMAARAWTGWSEWQARVAEQEGEHAVWVMVSHGDVIKALLARALGLELDAFQSIVVDPSSVSIVHHSAGRTSVHGVNLRDDAFARLAESAPATTSAGVVGGGDA